jgi:predicted alpha-1,2-mannosidase
LYYGVIEFPRQDKEATVRPTVRNRLVAILAGLAAALSTAAVRPGLAGAAVSPALVTNPGSLVNTLVMTTGGGNVFPGADVPFGMMQWSPDTSPDRSAGGGYSFTDTQLQGFSLTHLSGPGCGAMGDVPILPLTGPLPSGDPSAHLEPLTHTGEQGTAGSYTVMSGSPAIKTELTATTHGGVGRFTFPATTQADLLVKLLDSQNLDTGSTAQVTGNNEVSGSVTTGSFCGEPGPYTLHFDITFDHPFTASQVINGASSPDAVFLTFDTTSNQVVRARVGISFVSSADATANWQSEIPSINFDTVKTAAQSAWNTLLNQVQVAGGTAAQQQLFYTSLYHSLLHPNVVSDVNGQYVGFDGAVHTAASGHAQYDNFSGWDVYHGQTQLSALVAPTQTSDIAQSLLNDAAQGPGHTLPQWGFMNSYNYVMVGDPAQAALANYYAFGARSFDTATALSVMKTEATTTNGDRPYTQYENQLGYIPDGAFYTCCNAHGSLSSQLEYDDADFALSRFATALGDTATATSMLARANNWKNVFDSTNKLLTPRDVSGSFEPGVIPICSNTYVEGSAAQYRFVVPFDQPALATRLGGNAATTSLLDSFFTTFDGSNPNQAFLANEFDLGTPWFYNWVGAPSHTEQVVNRVENQLYQDTPAGFPNNDDLGTMSANYVWGALGFYPVTPGTADLVFNSPMFTQEVIHLAGGKTLTVNAPNASTTNFYVQSLTVNGTATTRNWLPAATWQSGATLSFTLGSTPGTWGTGTADGPPSYDAAPGVGASGAQPLAALFDNQGATDDTSQAAGNYDDGGFTYSEQQLTAAGLGPGAQVTVNGLTYTMPSAAAGGLDNVLSGGQVVSFTSPAGATRLGFVGSSTGGSSSGTAVITYTDGTTQSFTLGLTDWAQTPAFGNTQAGGTMTHRNFSGGTSQTIDVRLFEAEVPLLTGKTVRTVRLPLPTDPHRMHVFAIAAGTGSAPAAQPGGGPLATLFNDQGISDDSNPGAANYDCVGFSYSQQQLTAVGLGPGARVTANGLTFTMPNVGTGAPDNVMANGQTVTLTGAAGVTRLGFLGSGSNGNASGPATITFTDGTTQTFTLGLTDWAQSPAFGNTVVATMPARNSGGGPQQIQVFVFEAQVTLTAGKQVARVALPAASAGQLHVLAIATG